MLPPTGRRTPILALTAVAVGLFVVGGILLVGRLGVPAEAPSPSSAGPSAAPTDPTATPEGAVRAFFMAFATARRSDDPSLVSPFVTSQQSSAYLSVQGFLLGQKAANKASVLTVQRIDNVSVQLSGASAIVRLGYTEGGYDIDLNNGAPLESPIVLAPRNLTVQLSSVDGRWLVDSYATSQP